MARKQGSPGIGKTILALLLVAAAYYFLNRESGNTPPATNRERKRPGLKTKMRPVNVPRNAKRPFRHHGTHHGRL
jgi:hypothetical protein